MHLSGASKKASRIVFVIICDFNTAVNVKRG